MNDFLKKLAVALGLALLIVVGLLAARSSGSGAPIAPPPARAPLPPQPNTRTARALIPTGAWLIVDFHTSLSETAPFAGSPDPSCGDVAPPERAAVGILPPRATDDAPEIVLGAAGVSRRFFECAREQILASGGQESPVNPAIDFLKSKTGILLHEKRGAVGNLVFATGSPDLDGLVRALLLDDKDLPPSPHRAFPPPAEGALAHATLVLPPDWLEAAGPEGARSPLRHARGGFATLLPSGTVKARIDCADEGRPELRKFVERALADLGQKVPGGLGTPTFREEPGAIEVELAGKVSGLSRWLGRWGQLQGP
ncbi:MAG: hypothetical protein B6A08_11260 [Sorangiineae bacterium NIC37A_2]|mgnify:CR=1 FL=1|jgi:hypothetical protein|nr:MAG: hypothetical protein B6A08_11260 [Sorangiineae bacterium NIC37A_2]